MSEGETDKLHYYIFSAKSLEQEINLDPSSNNTIIIKKN